MPRFAELAATLHALERWLLPPECLLCKAPVPEREGDALVCALCRSRWRPIPDPVCARCGEPRAGPDPCRICAEWPAALARARSAVRLEGGARAAVHHLKYDGWWRLAEPMAAVMARLEPLLPGVCLVPVPLARRRERGRGYNQSERLASALSAALGLPLRAGLLRRARETPTQTALTPDERRANVAGAFAGAAPARGLRIVLVDDVFTTGATLGAAAEALSAAGAASVEAVTFARAAN
ncbi:MAG TPA: double zinc ribbon domain-containing protein [Gemmatimonadales bacterium]|nr:double zinc ribbon domain-containing protein [Gemmatimonadales bacterium]